MPTLGYPTIGGSNFAISAGTPVYAQYTAGSSFTATRMFIYIAATGVGTANLTMGIYADSSGSIGTLLGTTVESPNFATATTPGWVECDLASPVSIVMGDVYWLGVNHDNESADIYFDTGSVNSKYSVDAYAGGTMPAVPSSSGALSSADEISIYAEDAATPVAPTLAEGTVPSAGNVLTATLSQSGITPTSGTGLFVLTGTAATVASYSITGTTLTLSLGGLVRSADVPLLTYTRTMSGSDLVNSSTLYLANFSDAAVVNDSTQIAPTAQLICAGDSITYGYPGTGQGTIGGATWEATAFLALGPSWSGTNYAQDGATFASHFSWDAGTVDLAYDGSLAENVLIGAYGTNDCGVTDATGASVYATMLTWLANRRAANAGWKIIIPTVMPGGSGDPAIVFEGVRSAYNALLRSNAISLGITIADIAQDVRMGAPGAQADPTYFGGDEVHPTDAGRAILGEYYASAVWQALLPAGSSGGGTETFTHSGQRRRGR